MLSSAGNIEIDDAVSIMNSFLVLFILTVVKYLFLSVVLFIFSIRHILDSDWSDSTPIVVFSLSLSSVTFRILRLLFFSSLHALANSPFFPQLLDNLSNAGHLCDGFQFGALQNVVMSSSLVVIR